MRATTTRPFPPHEQQLQNALHLARTGHATEAIVVLRDLIAGAPQLVSARCVLAMLLHESGDVLAALQELDHAVVLAPNDALAQEVRSTVLLALGRAPEAEAAARAVLAINTSRPRAWQNLGLALDAQGRTDETVAAMQSALAMQPAYVVARQVLVRRLLQQKNHDIALQTALHESLIRDPAKAQAVVDDFLAAGARTQVIEFLQEVVRANPHSYAMLMQLARTLHQLGLSSEALQWTERAQAMCPDEPEPQEMQAVSLIDRGDVETGLKLYRKLLSRGDVGPDTANRHLILAHYDPAQSNESLFALHTDWVRRFVQPFGEPFVERTPIDPQRSLRIGWISPRFNAGPVASFFRDVLPAFDRERFRHVLVSLRAGEDTAKASFRELADEWLPLHEFDDHALLERLRAADFDIVIDLAGHSIGNRLHVLAQRVAPIQLCWLDYFNTTGSAAMDGWISDDWLTPVDSPQRYVETLLHLSSGRFCYSPPPASPSPEYIGDDAAPVFVSFNRLAKLNDDVMDAWSAILRKVPGASLELGAALLADTVARARTIERFAERGIGSERLRLFGKRDYSELLEAYRYADIALDPFPFSGCTTTCDALWMGVPVVTLPASTFVSRQSASLLWRMGRQEWVAESVEDYVARAIALAQRVEELRGGRLQLREQMRTSLCDSRAQAAELATLLRQLWCDHCAAVSNTAPT